MKNTCLTVACLVSFCLTFAQKPFSSRYNLLNITLEDGLQHHFIDEIYRDRQGFVWICTQGGGLSRYDGYRFVHLNTASQPARLKSNFISDACEDHFGRLWVASENGIDVIDVQKMRNHTFAAKLPLLQKLLSEPSLRLLADHNGALWIFARNTIYKIVFAANGELAKISQTGNLYAQPPLAAALADIDGDGNVWVGLGNGTVGKLYENEDNTLKVVAFAPMLNFRAGMMFSAFLKNGNQVWLGTEAGLVRFDRDSKRLKIYVNQKGNAASLSQNHVTDIALNADNTMIVSTLKGINIYDPITDSFEHFTADDHSETEVKLSSNFINCITVADDKIWLGTEARGVAVLTLKNLAVRNFAHSATNAASLSANPVNAIFEDTDGVLWVGTVEGGLNRKLPNEQTFSHFTAESSTGLGHNSVSAIVLDNKNRLWIGTWGGGISLLDCKNPHKKAMKIINSQTSHPVDFVGTLCPDTLNNGMWVGCNQGIFFYNFTTETLENPLKDVVSNQRFNGIAGAVIDRQNRLWMGGLDGVYIIDLQKYKQGKRDIVLFHSKLDEQQSALNEKITCFCLSCDGTLWLGSNGYGFYKHIPAADSIGKFVLYSTENGLINNNIRGILEDRQGLLWISTNNGLAQFDPRTESFQNFSRANGLINNEFYWNAYCAGKDGTLWFGGLNGLTGIDTSIPVAKNKPQKVLFTAFWVANREVFGVENILKIHETDKYFSLDFSALNFYNAASNFSYRLEGFDEQWTDVKSEKPMASYTSIPAGKYTFSVRYNAPGVPAADIPITYIKIQVIPVFYKTWWFILLIICILIGTAIYTYKRRVKHLTRQKAQLTRIVAERTAELGAQNEKLLLQNEKITRQKQQLLDMSEKIRVLENEGENRDKILINKALLVLERNYQDTEFNAAEFVSAMNVSKSLLGKKIKTLTGQTVSEFIRNYRLELAREMIIQNRKLKNLNISEIAYDTGFNDPKYFTRCFSRHFGVAPSAVSE